MSNIIIAPSHQIIFKPQYIGGEAEFEKPIPITIDQYNALKDALISDRFVEINGEMISTSKIDAVRKMPEPKLQRPEIWQFNTYDEYTAALDRFTNAKQR